MQKRILEDCEFGSVPSPVKSHKILSSRKMLYIKRECQGLEQHLQHRGVCQGSSRDLFNRAMWASALGGCLGLPDFR